MGTVSLTVKSHQSQLVMVDMQEKLIPAMPAEMDSVIKNNAILLQAAQLLEIPVIHTEQYPKGLGLTLSILLPYLPAKPAVEKITFSCCDEPAFHRRLIGDKPQVVVMGMESHICVLQTALDLKQAGKQVFVVEDAVISRHPNNKQNALNRLREAGINIVSAESVVFEWLGVAKGDAFKTLSQLIK
jgi:nicotinamidase-related amidase